MEYFTEFAAQLQLPKETAVWLHEFFDELHAATTELRRPGNSFPDDVPELNELTMQGLPLGFEVKPLGSVEGTQHLSIQSPQDKGGNVEAAVAFVEEVMAEFEMDDILCLEWSNSASRPVPGEFTGGAAIITKNGSEFINPAMIASKRISEMQQAKAPTP